MSKSLWASRHSTRLINVFVAGMLVFMGIQAAATAAVPLKPHRLERSHLPALNAPLDTDGASLCMDRARNGDACRQSFDHDFVYWILSASGVVTGDMKAQIRKTDLRPGAHGFRLTGTVSPRGPPTTIT